MNRTKISAFILPLLIFFVLISGCGGNGMHPEKDTDAFVDLIEQKQFEEITLTIYYISPFILTSFPLSVDDLVSFTNVNQIIIDEENLEISSDLLNKLSQATLTPVEQETYLDARLYYAFETSDDGKVFEVAMWGADGSIFVNGNEVENKKIFYDVLVPFLPEDTLKEIENYTSGIWPA